MVDIDIVDNHRCSADHRRLVRNAVYLLSIFCNHPMASNLTQEQMNCLGRVQDLKGIFVFLFVYTYAGKNSCGHRHVKAE